MTDGEKVITIILGGGRGSRLYPLTMKRAKPPVPIGGKYRLIDITLSNSINSGYRFIYVLTQYASDSLIRHIQETFTFGPFLRGHVQILAAQQTMESQDWYQGTADAVRQHMKRFKAKKPDYYLILSGDHLHRMDYRKLVAFHREGNFDATIAVKPVPKASASQFGILKLDSSAKVIEFVEKPLHAETIERLAIDEEASRKFGMERLPVASMGIYVFSPAVMEHYMDSRPEMNDFGSDILPNAVHEFSVGGYPFSGYWEDIGTVRSYYEASLRLVGPNAFPFSHPDFPIYTHRRYLSATEVQDAEITSSLISEGASIARSRIARSIIGIRSTIGADTEITESILMGNDYYEAELAEKQRYPLGVGSGTRLKRVIVDKNVRIGPGCALTNEKDLVEYDSEFFCIRDGIIVIPKDTIVPGGTKI